MRFQTCCVCSWVVVLATGARLLSAQCEVQEYPKLVASDAEAGDWFASSVALDGEFAAVGVPRDQVDGVGTGSVRVFRHDGTAWEETAFLVSSDAAVGDEFGYALALDGDRLVVGARSDDDNGSASGAAYVFRFDGTAWIEEAKLIATDGRRDDWLGSSVAIDGDVIVLGAPQNSLHDPGWAYVFRFDGTAWSQEAKLAASDGQARDDFGNAVAISGNEVLVGAWNEGNTGQSFPDGAGAVYAFTLENGEWTQRAKLVSPDPLPGELDHYGKSVAMDGDLAVIGTEPITTENSIAPGGSAYILRHTNGAWVAEAKLVSSDLRPGDRFGAAVGLHRSAAVVGAWGAWSIADACSQDPPFGGVCNVGAAYVFAPDSSGVWHELTKLVSSDAAEGDLFAWSVDMHGGRVFAGAWRDEDAGADTGAAYVFEVPCICPADLDGDGVVSTLDFLLFLGAWANGDAESDWNGDGLIDTRDFLAFLSDWALGC